MTILHQICRFDKKNSWYYNIGVSENAGEQIPNKSQIVKVRKGHFGRKGRWTLDTIDVGGRGGSEDWGEHGVGDEGASIDGRKSRLPTIRGGNSALKTTLKQIAKQTVKEVQDQEV